MVYEDEYILYEIVEIEIKQLINQTEQNSRVYSNKMLTHDDSQMVKYMYHSNNLKGGIIPIYSNEL